MSGPAARSLVSVVAFLRSLVRSGETLSADDDAMINAAIAAHAAEQAGQRARAEKLEKSLQEIERETRPGGDMADQAVNRLAYEALTSETP